MVLPCASCRRQLSAGSAGEAGRIQYQNNMPITELGCACNPLYLNQRIADPSNHDLSLPENAIYRDSDRTAARANDEGMKIAASFAFELKKARQPHERQDTPSISDDFVVLEDSNLGIVNFDDLTHCRLRDGESVAAHRYNQRVCDSEGERQPNGESGSPSGFSVQLE